MKIRLIIIVLFLTGIFLQVCAKTDLSKAMKKIDSLENVLLKETVFRESAANEIKLLQSTINLQKESFDSLCLVVQNNAKAIVHNTGQLESKIKQTNSNVETKADSSDVNFKTVMGVGALLLLLLLGSLIYYLLHRRIKKGNANVEELKKKAEKINEDILSQLSQEISEMQNLSNSLQALSKSTVVSATNVSEDHSLIKTLADRITFMEMTLFRMDSSVKGHKPLMKSIKQMKDNLLANGYELVEMLGKPYNDGMRVTANFVEDEGLEEGKRIITAVIKPQINFKGKMIQSAQITVSQNI